MAVMCGMQGVHGLGTKGEGTHRRMRKGRNDDELEEVSMTDSASEKGGEDDAGEYGFCHLLEIAFVRSCRRVIASCYVVHIPSQGVHTKSIDRLLICCSFSRYPSSCIDAPESRVKVS